MAPLRQSKLSRPVKKRRLGRNSDDSDAAPIQFEPQNEPSSDDETEIIATRKTPASASQKRRPVVLDSDSEIEVIVAPVPEAKKRVRKKVNAAKSAPKPTKKGKGKAQPAPKRKLVKGVRPASESGSDSDDLSGEHILESRLRDRGKKTAYQKKLAKYAEKRKQPKGAAPLLSSSEEDDSDSDSDTQPFEGAKPSDRDSLFDESSEDSKSGNSDFIVEDDGGAPVELPAQFRQAEDLAISFKKVFQFFLHIAMRPPDERHVWMQDQLEAEDDPYFIIPYRTMRKKLAGTCDSLVSSSIWPPTFTTPLKEYPGFEVIGLQYAQRGCDACKLSSRISTRLGRVTGLKYDKYGFQPFEDSDSEESENDSDSDDSEDSDVQKKKSKKRKRQARKKKKKQKVPSDCDTVRAEFPLGRFCARRATVFHRYAHWEYDLFQAILDEVERHRRSTDTQPDSPDKEADQLQLLLDQRGFIDFHWRAMRDLLDSAHNLDSAAKRGRNDDNDDD